MSCDGAYQQYLQAQEALTTCVARIRDYAEMAGGKLGENPMMLVGGDVASWKRYADEAERAARALRDALERYLEQAQKHT